ncbi:MAG: glutathione synthase [Pseudomonadota bacterium]
MILSFHPLIDKDENRLCAGRLPNDADLKAIQAADAVILPQGCYESLYDMARNNCPHVFPDYDARFHFPGKSGQARLFQKTGVPHPKTDIYADVADFRVRGGLSRIGFPAVFKFDWGGEGESVSLIKTPTDLAEILTKAERFEKTGQRGFVLQAYIPTAGRSLRIVVIGRRLFSYWRVSADATAFSTGISAGARIEPDLDPGLQLRAKEGVSTFCNRTQINLAGFDILFSLNDSGGYLNTPLFLEINYFFGRRGLGGSTAYHRLFAEAVEDWIGALGL